MHKCHAFPDTKHMPTYAQLRQSVTQPFQPMSILLFSTGLRFDVCLSESRRGEARLMSSWVVEDWVVEREQLGRGILGEIGRNQL